MMMIMHEPDKKTRRKWLSEPLLHFSEPADWRGGERQGRKKKVYFYSGIGAGGCRLCQGLQAVQSWLC